jgi:plastocyanin domain-containing protein
VVKQLLSIAVLALIAVSPAAADPKRVPITVTSKGFEPEGITVPAKTPLTLVFTRKTEATCTKKIVVKLGDGKTIERPLPLDTPVEIAVTFPKAGKLGYACSMDMNKGTITVQ